jgi:hypothetical protein
MKIVSFAGKVAGCAVLAILMSTNSMAQASAPASGQYQMNGGAYTVTLELSGANLIVKEPTGKVSTYTPAPDGSYHYRNPTNGILYGIRTASNGAIEAFKPDNTNAAPTRLDKVSTAMLAEPDDKFSKLADHYMEKAQSDSANIQSWTTCAGVAMKRAVSPKTDADKYAQEMANMLKQISATASPCPEVIPPQMF